MSKPVFTHDCHQCLFLGTVHTRDDGYGGVWDLWWHQLAFMPGAADSSSVICRYGNDGNKYSASMPPECAADPGQFIEAMKKHERPYIFAMARAVKLGLYTGPFMDQFTDGG